MKRRLALVLFLLPAALVAAGPASAEVSDADKASARTRLDQGRALLERGDAAGALAQFDAADALIHVPSTIYYRAVALAALGRLVEARIVARSALALPPTAEEASAPSPFREKAAALADALDARVSSLRVEIVGATRPTVRVDGAVIPADAGELPLDPGKHRVEAAAGDRRVSQDVTLVERERRTIRLDLSSALPIDAPPRERERTAVASGLVYGGFGVGVAGIVVGTTLGALASRYTSDARAYCTDGLCRDEARPHLDRADRAATLADVAFGVAGIGVAAGVIGLLLPTRERIVVVTGPTGLAVVGCF